MDQGYRLSLKSLDDLLARFEVRPIECKGEPFDSRSMSAGEVEETLGAPGGTGRAGLRRGRWWLSTGRVMNGMARCTARHRSGWRGAHGVWRRMSDLIIGIDLGTTNSEVAAFVDGKVRVLGPGAVKMLPSCVGISPSGELLVGESARNQQLVYPERTVRSIKRKMGSAETVLDRKSTRLNSSHLGI